MSALILVVDDEKSIRAVLRSVLEMVGYRVIEAKNGNQALARIVEEKPALLLLDVMMPHMDGLTACRQIRQHQSKEELPIMMLSALGQEHACLAAGANMYFDKPIAIDILIDSIDSLLNGS